MKRYVDKPHLYFIKHSVTDHEKEMQKYVIEKDIVNVPRVISYNKQFKRMVMSKVDGMTVADMYGENVKDVPDEVYKKLVDIVRDLKDNGVCYPDFTGYNFIIDNNDNDKIWVIDFEHAYRSPENECPCIDNILNGQKSWNTEFA